METTVVNRKTLIGEIVNQYPGRCCSESVCTASAVRLPRRRVLRMPAPFMASILKAS